jgi:hypothetical protein
VKSIPGCILTTFGMIHGRILVLHRTLLQLLSPDSTARMLVRDTALVAPLLLSNIPSVLMFIALKQHERPGLT